jgi:hypothetical protein
MEVKWDNSGAEMADDYVLLYGKWSDNGVWNWDIFYERELYRNSIKRLEFS